MPDSTHRAVSTLEKALEVNLDSSRYGTFAEIGAGQEVVRWFFQAGGAAGTISKSISAYDMQVSDAIYGDCNRYVSRQRLESMLAHEQSLNRQRLGEQRADNRFFTFADTVSARNFRGDNICHAWVGIRFQHEAGADDSLVVLHVRMFDDSNAAQQAAIGIVGVNLIYGVFVHADDTKVLLDSLADGLSPGRIEIDMVDVSGPAFAGVDNRVLALQLVELGLSEAAMFGPDGAALQSAEVMRKRPLLVHRGRFRPITHVNLDVLESSKKAFSAFVDEQSGEILPLLEMSLHDLASEEAICLEDFVSRAEVASSTGYAVLISDFREYYRLAGYLTAHTDRPIGLAMGYHALQSLFEERYYADLPGGILESFGRLFNQTTKLLIYPAKNGAGKVEGVGDFALDGPLKFLFEYLRAQGAIVEVAQAEERYLDIHSPDVLKMIVEGDERWAECVPESVADKIVDKRLFGYKK